MEDWAGRAVDVGSRACCVTSDCVETVVCSCVLQTHERFALLLHAPQLEEAEFGSGGRGATLKC